MTADPKLIDKLSTLLAPGDLALSDAAVTAADRLGLRAYLVGGPVRDLLLDRTPIDVDVAIEGDAIALAHAIAEATGARVAKTTVFLTATLQLGEATLDLVTARSETYTRRGALPKVSASTIDGDLRRRDFSINAMAIALNGPARGKLLDPAGGEADLRAGVIRVLHDESFRDDATRILRAARYEARFGFRIEGHTRDLLACDLRYLDAISGTRIRHELQRTFAEARPETALLRLDELGALRAIHPALGFGREQAEAFGRLREAGAPLPASFWPACLWHAAGQGAALTKRLALTRGQVAGLEAAAKLQALAPRLTAGLAPSAIANLLDPFPGPALWAAAAILKPPASNRILDYLRRLAHIRPALRGDDVIALGVQQGPRVAEVLARLRAAKLDGEATTRADEERIVRNLQSID